MENMTCSQCGAEVAGTAIGQLKLKGGKACALPLFICFWFSLPLRAYFILMLSM